MLKLPGTRLRESITVPGNRVLIHFLRRLESWAGCAQADEIIAPSKINHINPFRNNEMPFSYKCPKVAFIA